MKVRDQIDGKIKEERDNDEIADEEEHHDQPAKTPSLVLISFKRVLESSTVKDCDEIVQYTKKLRDKKQIEQIREQLALLPCMKNYLEVVKTITIEQNRSYACLFVFKFDEERYHHTLNYRNTSDEKTYYVKKCTSAMCHNGMHQNDGKTYYNPGGPSNSAAVHLAKYDRPKRLEKLGEFVSFLEALFSFHSYRILQDCK